MTLLLLEWVNNSKYLSRWLLLNGLMWPITYLQSQQQTKRNPNKTGATLLCNCVPPITFPIFHWFKAISVHAQGRGLHRCVKTRRWNHVGHPKSCLPKMQYYFNCQNVSSKEDTVVILKYAYKLFIFFPSTHSLDPGLDLVIHF